MNLTRVAVALSSLLLVGAQAPLACACSCGPGNEAEFRSRADVIFVGVVTSRHDPNEGSEDPSPGDPVEWRFDVEHVEKGTAGATETVHTARDSATCGFYFEIGSRYQVYAARDDQQRLWTASCSGTRKFDGDVTATPSPTPADPSPSPTVEPSPVSVASPSPEPAETVGAPASPSPSPTESPPATVKAASPQGPTLVQGAEARYRLRLISSAMLILVTLALSLVVLRRRMSAAG